LAVSQKVDWRTRARPKVAVHAPLRSLAARLLAIDPAETSFARRARLHIVKLGRLGVGYKQVADVASVPTCIVMRIRSGRRKKIRARTERRILAVNRHAIAKHAVIPAGPTWRRINFLLKEGLTKAELGRRLGYACAIQYNKDRITASNALKVERLYRQLVATGRGC